MCNAHIDPVWLWQRNEGIAAALSTFRTAADLCEEYDGFVFNHNEALLYEWVEEYEPALFARIQRLVKEGKRYIMGGWYLQPDCVMTSGESLLAQMRIGREYFDVLPGTAIKAVEEESLRTLSCGEEIVDKLYDKAFFKLCAGQPTAKTGEIPVLVLNPHPYEIEGVFEVEFVMQNQNWKGGEVTVATVYDAQGNQLPAQNEKSRCTFNIDWVKKVSFTAKLKPAGVTRFDCRLEVKKREIFKALDQTAPIEIKNDKMTARNSRETGLIELYRVDGKTYIENSGVIEVYRDNEDPGACLSRALRRN